MNVVVKSLFSLLLTFGVSGCAYTTVTRIDPNDANVEGIPFYECKPLISVSGSAIDVKYVKNPNKKYAIQFGAFLAKNDLRLKFERDCGITELEGKMDTTAIIQFLSDVLDKLAPDQKPVAAKDPAIGTVVQLYDVIFDDEGNIVRLRPLLNNLIEIKAPA